MSICKTLLKSYHYLPSSKTSWTGVFAQYVAVRGILDLWRGKTIPIMISLQSHRYFPDLEGIIKLHPFLPTLNTYGVFANVIHRAFWWISAKIIKEVWRLGLKSFESDNMAIKKIESDNFKSHILTVIFLNISFNELKKGLVVGFTREGENVK